MSGTRKPEQRGMTTKPKWPCLVQTRVSKEVFDRLSIKADAEGLSMASYMRRLIMADVQDMENKKS